MRHIFPFPCRKTVLIGCLIALFGVSFLVLLNSEVLYLWYEDVILDNTPLTVACEELPTLAEAQRVVAEQHELVLKIQAVPGFVALDVTDQGCPGKGFVRIWYGSHSLPYRKHELGSLLVEGAGERRWQVGWNQKSIRDRDVLILTACQQAQS
jgi:hypothetical protein